MISLLIKKRRLISNKTGIHLTLLQNEKFYRSQNQSQIDKTKKGRYGVPTSISRFNPSRLIPLENLKERDVGQKPQTLEVLRDRTEHAFTYIPKVVGRNLRNGT